MAGPGDLYDLETDFLEACAEALDTIPGSLGQGFVGAPDRAFVSLGTPAAPMNACDQLSVHEQPLGVGAAAPLNAAVIRVNRVTLVATLFRCGPAWPTVDEDVSVAAIEATARQTSADRWALWNYTFNKWCAKLLFEECGDVLNWGLSQLAPSGGMVGSTLSVTVSLGGYESTFGT
jgi:hypothetical protein